MQNLDFLNSSVKLDEIFNFRVIVDWYDGLTTGAYRRTETDKWMLANLCFFNPNTHVRVLTFIEVGTVDNDMIQRLPDLDHNLALKSIESLFMAFNGQGLLCMYDSLHMKPLRLSHVDANRIKFFASIEETLPENNNYALALKDIFPELDLSY